MKNFDIIFKNGKTVTENGVEDCDIAVTDGKICEIGDGDLIYEKPTHPYTRLLLAAIPDPNNKHKDLTDILEGELPSPLNPPSGCRFRTRCPRAAFGTASSLRQQRLGQRTRNLVGAVVFIA